MNKHTCKYKGCKHYSNKKWANVPLCEEHHRAIKEETARYYDRKISEDYRFHYQKIEQFIPWSRINAESKSS